MGMTKTTASWTWLFDLDNTLHDANPVVFPRIADAMNAYLEKYLGLDADAARQMRVRYWAQYGATLKGLVLHHGVNPRHFLQETHQFPDLLSILLYESALKHHLHRLSGQKILFSNAPRHYAAAVLKHIGLRAFFQDVWGLEDVHFHAKPAKQGYHQILRTHRLAPHQVIMVEDSIENLWTARQLGMKTVWISQARQRPHWLDGKVNRIADLATLPWLQQSK